MSEKKEEEVKLEEKEEDRDNVQLRRSQSSVSCFDFLFSNHHSAAKTCTVHWSPVWAPAVSSMWAVGGAVGPLYPLQCMLCIVGSAMQWVLCINVCYAVLVPAYDTVLLYCRTCVFLYSIHPWYCAQ